MKITVISPTRIEIDGEDAGLPLDVFLSREDLRPQIREAFVAWHIDHCRENRDRDAELESAKAAAWQK